jgi:hypothetical protein
VDSIVLSINSIPELLQKHFKSDKVAVHREADSITLTSIKDNYADYLVALDEIRNMLSGGEMSSERYSAQKQFDKELEL